MNTLQQLRAGTLTGTRRLRLALGLTSFPREIFALAETLEILDLTGNALSSLPDDLPRLQRLKIIFCSDNQFTELPAVLGQCTQLEMIGFKANRIASVSPASLPPALRWLILTDNCLPVLPAEIGACKALQKLMLSGNQLSALPPELAACTQLELLRIAANQLAELPDWLLALPRLSWLAYAGNPFCHDAEAAALLRTPTKAIAWHELTLADQLGEGASGVIHRASWQKTGEQQAVALKLFKGAITSDGLPHHEMNACISAGAHPSLIPVLGKIDRHPDGAEGLVMALIAPAFRTLAGPPSFASCTRDVYADDVRFTVDQAINLALGIASAAQHLHGQGILHGDLYAHNILHRQGDALLGDFGAASFFAPGNPAQAEALQRIEVRAFSCLLEELIACCDALNDEPGRREALADLQASCAHESAPSRPSFSQITQRLTALAR